MAVYMVFAPASLTSTESAVARFIDLDGFWCVPKFDGSVAVRRGCSKEQRRRLTAREASEGAREMCYGLGMGIRRAAIESRAACPPRPFSATELSNILHEATPEEFSGSAVTVIPGVMQRDFPCR